MALPAPNLDDRSFREILQDAIHLIPRYCPEWTNHNPSDPGIALLEVFAHLVEGMIWRINRIPEKATVEYLRLLGHRLLPALPARAPVTFTLAEGSEPRRVPAGTPLAAGEIPFETERDLQVGKAREVRCFSTFRGATRDLGPSLVRGEATPIFARAAGAGRFLHLGDPRLLSLRGRAEIVLEDGGAGVLAGLDWEFHDGGTWRDLPVRVRDRQVILDGPVPDMAAGVIQGRDTTWIRGRLQGETPGEVPRITLRASGRDLAPDRVDVDGPHQMVETIDPTLPFLPFGPQPEAGCACILASPSALARRDSRITLRVDVAGDPSPDLILLWEYPDGQGWSEIGRSTPRIPPPPSGHHFRDTTRAFARSGEISFLRPADMSDPEVRVRIQAGDYGHPPRPEGTGDSFRWIQDRPLSPPRITSIRIDHAQVPFPPSCALGQDDLQRRDLSAPLRDGTPIRPFVDSGDHAPSLHLGLDAPLPPGPGEIYFRIEEEGAVEHGSRVLWESLTEKGWTPVSVIDRTDSLTRSGSITFDGPPDPVRSRQFGEDLFWLRARWSDGGPVVPPRLLGIHLHTTSAVQGATVRGEILGHGDGTPRQEFRLASGPALAGITLAVGDDGDTWREVDSLAFSGRDATDFEFHPSSGIIRFGNGQQGRMPAGPVQAVAYRTGGGYRGNVGPGTISVMRRAVPGIDAVSNPYPAGGGVDPEGTEEAVTRALRDFRSRGRAVTADDFETLSLEASRSVGRAWCTSAGAGEVTVIILPRPGPGHRIGDPIATPRALVDEVRRYLAERSLVTTRVRCRGPSYREVVVEMTLVPATADVNPASLADRVEDRIREHLDPMAGGDHGWSPGRPLTRADIHAALSPLDEVDYLEEVSISPGGSRLDLDPHVLPVLARAAVRVARREA